MGYYLLGEGDYLFKSEIVRVVDVDVGVPRECEGMGRDSYCLF